MTSRALKKLWILIRFKALWGTRNQLLTVYLSRVRSILEFACPVFNGSLTLEQRQKIEMVQKKAFAIILGREYHSYETALSTLNQERLDTRRERLCLSFAVKCTKSYKHMPMFPTNIFARENMRHSKRYQERICRTSRHYRSPIPYLTRLLNRN